MATSPGTRARSIQTLDGYVSTGHAPPPSVPMDHAMLQDFTAYLELRLKSQNLSLLRRIFADFLNEQEATLVAFMQHQALVIALFPVLRTSRKRLELAQKLLDKPKTPLDTRGCVFTYLQIRTATRNMGLFRQLFLDFLLHTETALMGFVQRGDQVISVIPFELPRAPHPAPVWSPDQAAATEKSTAPKEPLAVTKRRRSASQKQQVMQLGDDQAASVLQAVKARPAAAKRKRTPKAVGKDKSASSSEPSTESFSSESPTSRRRPEASLTRSNVPGNDHRGVEELEEKPAVAVQPVNTPSPLRKRKPDPDTHICAGNSLAFDDKELPAEQAPPKKTRGRKPKKVGEWTKPKKKGKPQLTPEQLDRQRALAAKVMAIEKGEPWKVVFANVPAPFDESRYPRLSGRYRAFWRTHARAVWERNFWVPLSHKVDPVNYNARNNRQLSSKNSFETITIAAYQQLGPEFFVQLDQQRHPGWWYRRPILALYALEELQGEAAVLEFVEKNMYKRFPDCHLPLPLTSPNAGAVRRCHTSSSASMWANKHIDAPKMLAEIAQLKAALQQPNEVEVSAEPEAVAANTPAAETSNAPPLPETSAVNATTLQSELPLQEAPRRDTENALGDTVESPPAHAPESGELNETSA